MKELQKDDPGFDEARTGFQLASPHEPELLVAAECAADVQEAVAHALARGLPIAVQATGHGRAGALDGGVLISTKGMTGVRVDPQARTAWVEAGVPSRAVVEAAAPHGLAPLAGSSPGVGMVSYTLGGGVGLLARKHGFAADHVRRFELVTPQGRLLQVTPTVEPELFWALRGGGGNFGVVTGMEIGLVPQARMYGGGLYFDVAERPDVLTEWHRWTRVVPEDMTSGVSVVALPDVPALPAAVRGRHVAHLQIAYAGPAAEGERLVAPLRELDALRDTVRELPFTESGAIFEEPDFAHAYRSSNLLVRELDTPGLAALPAVAGPAESGFTVVGLRHLGGALARPPAVPSAVGHRDSAYSVNVISTPEPEPAELHRRALAPFRPDAVGRLLNFSYGPLTAAEVAAGFDPEAICRLAELRLRHDPQGLLHANHPIPTAG